MAGTTSGTFRLCEIFMRADDRGCELSSMMNAVKRAKNIGVPLIVIGSPHRSILRHLVEYVDFEAA